MKRKGEIAKLEEEKFSVPFPTLVPAWDSFRRRLLSVLEMNGLGNAWEWEESEQKFYREFEEVAQIGEFRVRATLHVDLDPAKPLDEEITRLIEVRRKFIGECSQSVYDARRRAKALVS